MQASAGAIRSPTTGRTAKSLRSSPTKAVSALSIPSCCWSWSSASGLSLMPTRQCLIPSWRALTSVAPPCPPLRKAISTPACCSKRMPRPSRTSKRLVSCPLASNQSPPSVSTPSTSSTSNLICLSRFPIRHQRHPLMPGLLEPDHGDATDR